MKTNKQTIAANSAEPFLFDRFYGTSVIVKNMTAGAVQFSDGSDTATIPAHSWQTFDVSVPYGETPKFSVIGEVAGDVEIGFGSCGMGTDFYTLFNQAGMLPHTLTLEAAEDTLLAVMLVREHGNTLDLDVPVALTSGATVYAGDVIEITATATNPMVTINGNAAELDDDNKVKYTIAGNTVVELTEEAV